MILSVQWQEAQQKSKNHINSRLNMPKLHLDVSKTNSTALIKISNFLHSFLQLRSLPVNSNHWLLSRLHSLQTGNPKCKRRQKKWALTTMLKVSNQMSQFVCSILSLMVKMLKKSGFMKVKIQELLSRNSETSSIWVITQWESFLIKSESKSKLIKMPWQGVSSINIDNCENLLKC